MLTGGTSGIGLALAEQLIKENNTVIVTGRREDRLAEIKSRYPQIITKISDVADAAERVELAQWLTLEYPGTNVLINNAGVQLVTDLTKTVDLNRIQSEIETNFTGPMHLTSLLVPVLKNNVNSTIINITSGLAYVPIAGLAVYCATKAAMHSLTISLRFQLRKAGFKVFEIAPPEVDTELGHDRREDKNQSHGGMSVDEFVGLALEALKADTYEAPIGSSIGLRVKREEIFEQLNGRFES